MRRKVRAIQTDDGTVIPLTVLEFRSDEWPGDKRGGLHDDFARYEAWNRARIEWAESNLPNGLEDLPEFTGHIPDAPWDPSVI